jgi:predicted acylesterase/phospholipase RssA
LVLAAGIPGVSEARFWDDQWPEWSEATFANYAESDFRREYSAAYEKPHAYLAISGGGENGAFGAGLLNGWTAAGNRPEFLMVTGISAGALAAPFVFLGPDYDDELKTVFTTTATKDIATKRGLISGLFSDSLADTTPMKNLLATYITQEMVDAIAREHRRGRRLFIGTVSLDAGRSVIWNIGAIADSDYPDKDKLIQDILRASASIPVAFPPISISVEANGESYQELHVDGGAGSQVFVYPASMDFRMMTEKLRVQGTPEVYIVRNAFFEPDYQEGIRQRVLPIASRTLESLIRTQGIGDLYRIFALCRRDGNDFNLAYIPSDFTEEPNEAFDPIYMSKLFELGYQMGRDGYPWAKAPPGLVLED